MKMNVGDMGLVLAVVLLVLGESSIRAQESSPVLFDSVSAGVFVTCAISTEKDLYCFGNNDDGAVGDGTQETRTAPTLVAGEGEWCKISGGDWHVSGTKCNGEGYSWGYNGGRLGIGKEDPVQATTPQKLEDSWREVSAGHFHGCGIKTDGKAYCWGNNRNGRMGTGGVSEPQDYVLSPQPVQSNGNWVSISAKGSHTCGLQDDDSAWCWGGNEDGEIGNGESGNNKYVETPYQIPGEWKFIQSGLRFSCGIDMSDALYCWGALRGGGSPSAIEILGPDPIRIGGNSTWKSISGGMQHACGILTNDTARCFGLAWHGQLGNGEQLATGTQSSCPSNNPCEPKGGYKWKDISAGEYNSCGVLSNGTLVCFGENPYGQLGNGQVGGEYSYEPTVVLPATRSLNSAPDVTAVSPSPSKDIAPEPAPALENVPESEIASPETDPITNTLVQENQSNTDTVESLNDSNYEQEDEVDSSSGPKYFDSSWKFACIASLLIGIYL